MKKYLCKLASTQGNSWSFHHWRRQVMITMLVGCLLSSAAIGQTQQWVKSYGSAEGDFLTAMQQTSDGGYVLGGYSYSDRGGDKSQDTQGDCISAEPNYRYENCVADFWVIKVDASGAKVWDKTYGGPGDDRLVALQQTSDGGYVLGGTTLSALGGDKTQDSLGKSDYWVVKLDALGNKQWDKTFGGTEKDEFSALRQTHDGGYILGGDSYSDAGGDKSEAKWTRCDGDFGCTPDYWVLKLDAAGNKEWDRTLGGRATEHLAVVQQATDGGFIAAGHSYSGANGNKTSLHKGTSADFWLVKLSAAGKISWDKSYGSVGRDLLTALEHTADGGYIVGGYVKSGFQGDITGDNNGDSDYWILKLDAAGHKQWDKTFGGRDPDFLYSVHQTSEGGYILGGSATSNTFTGDYTWGRSGFWVIKLDAAGAIQWDKPFDIRGYKGSLQQTQDGGYIIGATTEDFLTGDDNPEGRGREDFRITKISGGFDPILPEFDSFSPKAGLPGSTVTITGKNLGKTKSVWFYGAKLKKAKFKRINDETITTTVPHSAKSGNIFLFTALDTLESAEPYLVQQPVITAILPGQGPVGTTVTLEGERLSTTTEVHFNNLPATEFTVISDAQLTAVVPEGATTGPVRVLLAGGGKVTTRTSFSVTPGAPAGPAQARKGLPAGEIAPTKALDEVVFPNPFYDQLTYRFALSQPQQVTVKVYDLLGRGVQVLYRGAVQAHQATEVTWRPLAHQPGGFYIIRLQAPGQESRKKVLLSR
jgi:hypothetical protein